MMQIKWKQTTYEVAREKAEELLAKLREDERFTAVCERAATLGLEVDVTYQHTYINEGDIVRAPVQKYEGRVPRGYALALWVDLVKDGHVVCCGSFDNPVQFSSSVMCGKYVDLLFSQKVTFLEYENLFQNDPLFEMLEEYLDMAEEHGTTPSLFLRDELAPTLSEGDVGFVCRAEIEEGSYTALAGDSEYYEADALYIQSGAFFPYNLMLYSATGKVLGDTTLTLTQEETEALLELLDNLPHEMRQCENFADLLVDGLGFSAMIPTPRMAQYLDEMTYLRYRAFLENLESLTEYIRGLLEDEKTLILIP